jgi:diadenosine tetraphosphate (Ap4A) HIT family hydrolase
MFELDSRLKADSYRLGSWPLCEVLLSKDAQYPWCILVPRRENISETHHLSMDDRQQLLKESCHLAELMTSLFSPDKMNVAALGNVVPQLHVHHIARYHDDPAWPGPVWGAVPAKSYEQEALQDRLVRLRGVLSGNEFEASDDGL